jgi:hypothetical protein
MRVVVLGAEFQSRNAGSLVEHASSVTSETCHPGSNYVRIWPVFGRFAA